MRRLCLALILVVLAAAACGDGAGPFGSTRPDETSSTGASPTTTETTTTEGTSTTAGSTTAAETTTTGETTTTAPPPSAADALEAFFTAAEQLDADIRAAAVVFNAGFDADAGTLDPGVAPVVEALDAVPLGLLIPGGLSLDLETAVLRVFADLDGRIAALSGGVLFVGWDLDAALNCLTGAGPFATRFPTDLADARARAAVEAPPTAPGDSPEAGILAVRLAAIHSLNWGCESCGVLDYGEPLPVDWAGRTVSGVEFEATFNGVSWDVLIYAC